jgi:hypothetical protein
LPLPSRKKLLGRAAQVRIPWYSIRAGKRADNDFDEFFVDVRAIRRGNSGAKRANASASGAVHVGCGP